MGTLDSKDEIYYNYNVTGDSMLNAVHSPKGPYPLRDRSTF